MQNSIWNILTYIMATLGPLATFGGILFVARQIADGRRFAKAQFINQLEEEITSLDAEYVKLFPGDTWSSSNTKRPDLENLSNLIAYIAFFEKIKLLIDSKTIDICTVDRLFALRFFRLVHNPYVQNKILYSDQYKDCVSTIFALHQEWADFRKNNKLRIPGESSLESIKGEDYRSAVEQYKRKRNMRKRRFNIHAA